MLRSNALIRLITRAFGSPGPDEATQRDTAPEGTARLDCGWERHVEAEPVSAARTTTDRRGHRLLPTLLLLLAAACAGRDATQAVTADEPADPLESVNRAIFEGNLALDRAVLRPVARVYREHVPQRVRTSVGNFAGNLGEPRTLVNDLLQGNTTRAWNTTQRFVVNTTLGVAGLFDVASEWGLPRHNADFGQTLGVWGVGPGPVTQLPLLGHSNLRDTVGTVAGFVGNPLGYVPGASTVVAAGNGVGVVDMRARMLPQTDAMEATSLDFYAAVRSAREQHRASFVEEGRQGLVGTADRAYGRPEPTDATQR